MTYNYLELYKKNIELKKKKNSEIMKKYEEYILNPNKMKCPSNKKDKIIIINDENEIIVKCEKNNEWFIKITKTKSINLYEKKEEIKNLRNYILNNISNNLENNELDKSMYDKLKNNYIEIDEEYKKINEIFDLQNTEIDIIINEILDLKFNIGNIYYEKKNIYNEIKEIMNIELNKKIKKIYFENDKMSDDKIKKLSNDNKIPIDNIKKILEWYKLNKKYIELINELKLKELNFNDFKNELEYININFIIKFPDIIENNKYKNILKKYNKVKIKK